MNTNTNINTNTAANTANTITNMLYLSMDKPDRSKTQLAYAANYLPKSALVQAAANLICWSRTVMLHKHTLIALLNEEMTTIRYMPAGKHLQEWAIHWRYNSIPTQIEWERKTDKFILSCEFRVIADGSKVALLSF